MTTSVKQADRGNPQINLTLPLWAHQKVTLLARAWGLTKSGVVQDLLANAPNECPAIYEGPASLSPPLNVTLPPWAHKRIDDLATRWELSKSGVLQRLLAHADPYREKA